VKILATLQKNDAFLSGNSRVVVVVVAEAPHGLLLRPFFAVHYFHVSFTQLPVFNFSL